MTKLNKGSGKISTAGPLTTSSSATGTTYEGGTGYARSEKTELYLRATTMFAGEKSFYETGAKHDERSIELVRQLAVDDWPWVSSFLPWLRASANIRTMSIMLAAEAVHARLDACLHEMGNGGTSNRRLIDKVLHRPDEPGEMLQYWLYTHGRDVPQPVKRGVADAATRMYVQRNVLRWDGKGPMEFADVLELTHPKIRKIDIGTTENPLLIRDGIQAELFPHLITMRKGREGYIPPFELAMIRDRYDLSRLTPDERHAFAAKALQSRLSDEGKRLQSAAAGSWEWVMSWLGEPAKDGLTKRQQWELIIPDMGYMALLRNMRNFDEAGLKDSLKTKICQQISSITEVTRSKQLPFRFLSAYKAAPSLKWGDALEKALQASVPNIPVIGGKTLVLIDMSGSMQAPLSTGRPDPHLVFQRTGNRPSRMEAGALFGVALALRNQNTDVWGFADGQFKIDNITQGASILKTVKLITDQCGRVGHGTQIERAVRDTFKDHDRVCIFTDMQTMPAENGQWMPYRAHIGDVTSAVPKDVHVYGFNLAGYSNSGMPTGSFRHEMGGLTDHTFGLIPLLEAGAKGTWPWAINLKAPAAWEDDD